MKWAIHLVLLLLYFKNDEILNNTDSDVSFHFDIITLDDCNVKNDVEVTMKTLINIVVSYVDTVRKNEFFLWENLKLSKSNHHWKEKVVQKTNVIELKRSSSKNSGSKFCNLRFDEKLRKTLSICIGQELAEKVLSCGSRVQLKLILPHLIQFFQ